jgi:hypothetical protein
MEVLILSLSLVKSKIMVLVQSQVLPKMNAYNILTFRTFS